jgi:hypothetical protein
MATEVHLDQRGALIIEFVAVVPLYALLWLGANHAFDLYRGVVENVATVRNCAWQFADSGCITRAGGCNLAGPIPQKPLDGEVKRRLRPLERRFPFLRPEWNGPMGASFVAEKTTRGPGPPGFSSTTFRATYAGMCDPKVLVPWSSEMVFMSACKNLGKYCW